jgi:hypothetical protein
MDEQIKEEGYYTVSCKLIYRFENNTFCLFAISIYFLPTFLKELPQSFACLTNLEISGRNKND